MGAAPAGWGEAHFGARQPGPHSAAAPPLCPGSFLLGGPFQTPRVGRGLFLFTANPGGCFEGGILNPPPIPSVFHTPREPARPPTRLLQLPGWHQPPHRPAAQPDFSHAKPRLKLLSPDCVYL